MENPLHPFLNPSGVVIIGASTSPEKLGYGTARNLIQSGFAGNIQFISQRRGKLLGKPVHTSLDEASDPLDLAVLIVPAHEMLAAIHACGRRGIRAAILIASGFREAGSEGAALEAECLSAARSLGMRLIGPNCIGIINTHLPLDTTFLQPPLPSAGSIGFISQSGAFCAAIIDLMRDQGFGFSHIISLGNRADINETEALPAVAADGNTKVIVLYMESVMDGRNFIEAALQVTRQKPVIALKVGRFGPGKKAAASHTGALVGEDHAFEAAFEKAGILRAETAEQMFDWARALADCPLPTGRRIAILTNAGGPGVIAADTLESCELDLARLNKTSLEALAAILPAAASIQNPVDMLASASPAVYTACLRALLADPDVDQVLLILPPPPMYTAESVAEAIIPVIQGSLKPVAISLMGSLLTAKALDCFERAHIPTFPFPERAVSALGALARRAEFLAFDSKLRDENEKPAERISRKDLSALELVASYGIQTAPTILVHDAQEASLAASTFGFPVVLKIASPDILHKSNFDGVLLGQKTPAMVEGGFENLINRVKTVLPKARIEGVLVQKQIQTSQEVIVGMKRDPQFGPLIIFGSGGVDVEGLLDTSFCLAPVNDREAGKMLERTWAGRKLKGFRNQPAGDEVAVKKTIIQLSKLAMEHEQIQEIEINPLCVHAEGAIAVDARIIYQQSDP